nr:putative dolichyldiphosphatase [Quercus suber]
MMYSARHVPYLSHAPTSCLTAPFEPFPPSPLAPNPTMDDPPLASLTLTHVHYNPNDPLSLLCAYLALVPQVLMITYATLLWSTREVEIALMLAGQLGCEALNWVLKRWIREQRPTLMHGKGYGMPSSHAQFVAYFATFISLFLLLRHQPHHTTHSSSTHVPTPFWQLLALSASAVAWAAAVAYSRVYLAYHSPRQVYVGCAVGFACALAWFVVTGWARRVGWVEALLEVPIVRWSRFRDLVVSEDPVDAGWERWELRRRGMREKKSR